MAPMPSTEPAGDLPGSERALLIGIARQSIEHGLEHGRPLAVSPTDYPPVIAATRASFVTLQRHRRLRGCIGHLEALQPLVVDVAQNAFAAAFRDPRFRPLERAEWPEVEIHLSLLSTPEALRFGSEAELIRQIRPGVDGLILQDGARRGTFLPSVWENLPDPVEFVIQLKHKAGFAATYWSDSIEVWRYRTESFAEHDLA